MSAVVYPCVCMFVRVCVRLRVYSCVHVRVCVRYSACVCVYVLSCMMCARMRGSVAAVQVYTDSSSCQIEPINLVHNRPKQINDKLYVNN